jgi:hypothetical protein
MQGPASAERSRSCPPPPIMRRRNQNKSTHRHYERRSQKLIEETSRRLFELYNSKEMQSGIAGT